MSRRSRLSTFVGMVALGAVSACGTTVPMQGQGPAVQGLGGPSTGSVSAGTNPAAPPGGGLPGAATTGQAPGAAGGAAGTGGSAVPGSTIPAASGGGNRTGTALQGPSGPGVTRDSVTVGIPYVSDAGAADKNAGAGGTDPGDVRNYYSAAIEAVNKEGGVAGRRLSASYFELRDNSTDSRDTQLQNACEHWTNDVKVFAMLEVTTDSERHCAEQRGVLSLATGGGNAVEETFRSFPHYVEPSNITLDRAAVATVNGLQGDDYYGQRPVIGVITWDSAAYRTAVQTGLRPALSRLGYAVKDSYFVSVPQTLGGAAASSSAVGSAILKFQQDGVDHVFIVDGPAGVCEGACLTLLVVKAAASQDYHPRYGMNDNNAPQVGIDSGLWTAADIRGARAVTWSDADDKSDAGVAVNAARKRCLSIMAAKGLRVANPNMQLAMLKACDYIFFLRDVLGTASAPVTRDRFIALTSSLGSGFRSPEVYLTRFSTGQHDGVAGFRRQTLDDQCQCFRYTSGVYE